MARRSVSAGMTRLEKILGGGLLAIYLFVLPLTTTDSEQEYPFLKFSIAFSCNINITPCYFYRILH